MKRFYKEVGLDRSGDGFRILLDGKPVKTPGRNLLLLPTRTLAEAIAGEWRIQGEKIVPASMPMLRLANTALDGVARTREAVIAAILRFGEHDLICYRAAEPADLAARQREAWTPMLDWADSRYGARFASDTGLTHVAQPPETLLRLEQAIAERDDFALAALHVMASITGSLILALALAEGEINPAQGFQLSRIDEDYQAGLWGEDAEAAARARALAREMDVAAAFLAAARD
ncbi:MAG TPA: ATP12 family protein [Rhizomicrobium sp.]|jgi:chaperone required for assembly of F1-ATPase|nr:ATP12 family protein [Rhizomicrobium sp.]